MKNNKLIAKFMGWKHDELSEKYIIDFLEYMENKEHVNSISDEGSSVLSTSEMKFHNSYGWIMPVLEKIGKMENFLHPNGMYKYLCSTNLSISNNCITIKDIYFADEVYRKDDFDKKIKKYCPEFTERDYVPFIEYYEKDMFTNIYNACVEFIKWYNKSKLT